MINKKMSNLVNFKDFKSYFINESHQEAQESIKDIFLDLTDNGYKLNIEKGFFSEHYEFKQNDNKEFNKLGFSISLRKDIDVIDESKIISINELISECVDRLSEIGNTIIRNFSFQYYWFTKGYIPAFSASIYVILDELDLLDENLYKFRDSVLRNFRNSDNKVTKNFKMEYTDYGVILKPKREDVVSKSLLSVVKSQFKKWYKPLFYTNDTTEFKYDIELEDNNIKIIFKEFYITRRG